MTKQEPTNLVEQQQTKVSRSRNYEADLFNPERLNQMIKFCKVMIESEIMPKSIDTPGKALIIMQAGIEAGMKPLEAMNAYAVVNGQISIMGKAGISQLKKQGYKVEFKDVSDDSVTCKITNLNGETDEDTITMEYAKSHKWHLSSRGFVKEPWERYPQEMLQWKVFSRVARRFAPEALGGYYLAEELDDIEYNKVEELPKEIKIDTPQIAESVKPDIPKGGSEISSVVVGEVKSKTALEENLTTKAVEDKGNEVAKEKIEEIEVKVEKVENKKIENEMSIDEVAKELGGKVMTKDEMIEEGLAKPKQKSLTNNLKEEAKKEQESKSDNIGEGTKTILNTIINGQNWSPEQVAESLRPKFGKNTIEELTQEEGERLIKELQDFLNKK